MLQKLETLPTPSQNCAEASGPSPEHLAFAMERAEFLFGQFRRSDATDPKRFAATIGINLAQFDREVIEHVTDPLHGLATKRDYPPSVRELREACADYAKFLRLREEAMARAPLAPTGPIQRPVLPKGRVGYAEATDNGRLRPIGRFEDDSAIKKYNMAPRVKDLVRQSIGATHDEWDAIPNARAKP